MNSSRFPTVSPGGRIHWLTDIPDQWRVVPSKWLFSESKLRAQEGDEQLSATQAYGVIPQAEFERLEGRQVVHSFLHQDKRKHVELDDFVISMRSFQGGLERAWARGAIRSSYVVLHPSRAVHPPYFGHIFKSTGYIQALQATSNFIRDGQDLNWNNFTLVNLPLVPMAEQKAIADFLDRKTAAIDALIDKKQKLLDLLAEKRAAFINRAVTKGLDPKVPMKDSGVPWIGEIPANWEVKRLKCVLDRGLRNGLFKKKEEFGRGTSLVNVSDVYQDTYQVNCASLDRVDATASEQRTFGVRHGDVFFVRSSLKLEGVAASACVLSPPEQTVFECHLVGARPDLEVVEPVFLVNYLNTSLVRQRLVALATTTTMTTIAQDRIADIQVLVPPMAEQRAIADHVVVGHHRLAAAGRAIQKQIGRLREYRQALITEAVTGKLRVEAGL